MILLNAPELSLNWKVHRLLIALQIDNLVASAPVKRDEACIHTYNPVVLQTSVSLPLNVIPGFVKFVITVTYAIALL